ncbi:50S ribosomal protein P1 [Candidatus Woesearchaeota archaeon]|nr:MAG: 50S ribosomal protein P1 [Candidatus Woesearchaeota archaeon]
MEYIYAAMLLHKAGQKIDEDSVKKVLEAANVKPDTGRIKALVAALDGVDIDKAISEATVAAAPTAAPTAAPESGEKGAEKKEEKPKEEKKSADEAAAGLGALFG